MLQVACRFTWLDQWNHSGLDQFVANVVIAESLALDQGVMLGVICRTKLNQIKLSVRALSSSLWFTNMFIWQITRYLESQIDWQLCPHIQPVLSSQHQVLPPEKPGFLQKSETLPSAYCDHCAACSVRGARYLTAEQASFQSLRAGQRVFFSFNHLSMNVASVMWIGSLDKRRIVVKALAKFSRS